MTINAYNHLYEEVEMWLFPTNVLRSKHGFTSKQVTNTYDLRTPKALPQFLSYTKRHELSFIPRTNSLL